MPVNISYYNGLKFLHRGSGNEQKLFIFRIINNNFMISDSDLDKFISNLEIIYNYTNSSDLKGSEIFQKIRDDISFSQYLGIRGDLQISILNNFYDVLSEFIDNFLNTPDFSDIKDTLLQVREDIGKENAIEEKEVLPPALEIDEDEVTEEVQRKEPEFVEIAGPTIREAFINSYIARGLITNDQALEIIPHNKDSLYLQDDLKNVGVTLTNILNLFRDINNAIKADKLFIAEQKKTRLDAEFSRLETFKQKKIDKEVSTKPVSELPEEGIVDVSIPQEEKEEIKSVLEEVKEKEVKPVQVTQPVEEDDDEDEDEIEVVVISKKDKAKKIKEKEKKSNARHSEISSGIKFEQEEDISKIIRDMSLEIGFSADTKYLVLDIEKSSFSIDKDAILSLFEKYKTEFLSCMQEISNFMRGSSASSIEELRVRLNIVAHKIKIFDYYLYTTYKKYINILSSKISELTDYESFFYKNLILLKNDLIKLEGAVQNQFMSKYMSELNASKFYSQLIFISKAKNDVSDKGYLKYINVDENYDIREYKGENASTLENEYITAVEEAFVKAYYDYFYYSNLYLDIEKLNDPSFSNFVDFVFKRTNAKLIFQKALLRTNNLRYEPTSLIKCGTCNKLIPLVSSKISSERKERWGAESIINTLSIPFFYPFKENRLISEDDLVFDEQGRERVFTLSDNFIKKYYLGANLSQSIKITKQKILEILDSEYASLTWAQILQLLQSGNESLYIIGSVMKAVALDSILNPLGSEYRPRAISSVKSLCPFKGTYGINGDVTCGISFSVPQTEDVKIYNLQPKFNEVLPDRKPASVGYSYEYPKVTRTEINVDERLKDQVISKYNAGFKYSNLTINCPTFVGQEQPLNLTLSEENKTPKYDKVALNIAGNNAFAPLTDGIELPNNLIYHVCSSETSISCIDRDPTSPTYFLRYLDSLRNNEEAFVSLIKFLIDNGFDDIELINMLSDFMKNINSQSVEASLNKINKIIVKNAANIDSDILEIIKDITLVCPQGHKFTIEQAIKFGASHAYIRQRSEYKLNQFLFKITNFSQVAQELIKQEIIIPLREVPISLQDKHKYYDEWIQVPVENRRLSIKKARKESRESFVYLKILINDENYVFGQEVDNLYNNPNSFQLDKKYDVSRIILEESIVRSDSVNTISGKIGPEDEGAGSSNQLSQDAAKHGTKMSTATFTEWDKALNNIISDTDIPIEYVIPGTQNIPNILNKFKVTNKRNVEKDIGKNIGPQVIATLKTITALLEVIENWRSRILDIDFSSFLSFQKTQGEGRASAAVSRSAIQSISENIFNNFIISNITVTTNDDEVIPASVLIKEQPDIFNPYIDLLVNLFINNVKIKNLINLQNVDESEDLDIEDKKFNLVRDIITETLFEFSAKFLSIEAPMEDFSIELEGELIYDEDVSYLDFDSGNLQNIANKILNSYVNKEQIYDEFLLMSEISEYASYDLGKVSIISYIKYITYVLKRIYILYFNSSSLMYLNIKIFDNILDSEEKIFNITKSEIENLNTLIDSTPILSSSSTANSIIGSGSSFIELYRIVPESFEVGDVSEFEEDVKSAVQNYLSMLTKANYIIDLYIKQGPYLISQPKVVSETVNFVKEKIAEDFLVFKYKGKKSKGATEVRFGESITLSSSTYSSIVTDDPSKEDSFCYSDIVPLISNEVGRGKPEEFIDHFYKNLKVNGYIAENPEYNYYSNDFQIGAIRNRPLSTTLRWPPPEYGYYNINSGSSEGYIGIYLPINNITNSNQLSELAVTNLKVVVKIPIYDSENSANDDVLKIDISFLFAKSVNKQTADKINSAVREYKELMRKWNDLRPEQRQDEKNKDYINQYIASLRSLLNSFPYEVSHDEFLILDLLDNGTSLQGFSKQFGDKQRRAYLTIVDPVLAFNLINNPDLHGVPLVNLGAKNYSEEFIKSQLTRFICEVYNIQSISNYYCSNPTSEYISAFGTSEPLDAVTFLEKTATEELQKVFEKKSVKEFRNLFIADKKAKRDTTIRHGRWFSISVEDTSISWNMPTRSDGSQEINISKFKSASTRAVGVTHIAYEKDSLEKQMKKSTIPYRAYDAIRRFIRKKITAIEEIDPDIYKESMIARSKNLNKYLSLSTASSTIEYEDEDEIDLDLILR